MKHWRVITLLLLLTAACTPARYTTSPIAPCYASQLMENNGHPQNWLPSRFPLEVQLADNLPKRYKKAVRHAVDVWNSVVGVQFLIETYEGGPTVDISISMEDLGTNKMSGARLLGRARNNIRHTTIQYVNIRLDTEIWNQKDLVHVATHELGHAMGLRHDDEDKSSLMYPLTWSPEQQFIQWEDIEAIRIQVPPSLETQRSFH